MEIQKICFSHIYVYVGLLLVSYIFYFDLISMEIGAKVELNARLTIVFLLTFTTNK